MESLVLLVLLLAALPFVLPVISLVAQARLRRRVRVLEDAVVRQQQTIHELKHQLAEQAKPPAPAPSAQPVAPPPIPKPAPVPPAATPVPPPIVSAPPVQPAAPRRPIDRPQPPMPP